MSKTKIVYVDAFNIPGIDYENKPPADYLDVKSPDTDVEVRRAPDAFVHFVEQTYETELTAVLGAREAWKVEQEGDVDAILFNCNAEPGVKAARELCDVLVMGPACAVMHVASMLGRSFSYVICGREGDIHHAKDSILTAAQHYELSHKIASIREIAVPPTGFNEALLSKTELENLKQEALSEAKKAINEDGADVIIAYGGPELYDYLVKQLHNLGIPIISPIKTLHVVAEMLVRLGLTHSKRTYPKPRQIYDFKIEQTEVVSSR